MCDTTSGRKQTVEVGIGRTVNLPFDAAMRKIEEALQKEGFGVLTRIDVQETLKTKIGVDQAPFVILGACNPQLAHRALAVEPRVGLFLPCNVVVREVSTGRTRVEAMNPDAMIDLFPEAGLETVAHEARQKLARVIDTFDVPFAT
jgi:uncharacterized protein (DUF302 family)